MNYSETQITRITRISLMDYDYLFKFDSKKRFVLFEWFVFKNKKCKSAFIKSVPSVQSVVEKKSVVVFVYMELTMSCINLCSHTVCFFAFFHNFLCSFHIFFLVLPLKAVSPWVGLCFQDILVWCAYGNASWRHHRHDIKKGRYETLVFIVKFW